MTKPVTHPERIYLQNEDAENHPEIECWWKCTTWCQDRVNKDDAEYVRVDLYESANREIARLRKAFGHYHVAAPEKGIDTCAQCGLDLRNPIHSREALSPATTTLEDKPS